MGYLAEPVLDVDPAVVLRGKVADDIRRVPGKPGGPAQVVLERRAPRRPEVERHLVLDQRARFVLGLDVSLPRPRGRHLLAELDWLERRQLPVDFVEPTCGGNARG